MSDALKQKGEKLVPLLRVVQDEVGASCGDAMGMMAYGSRDWSPEIKERLERASRYLQDAIVEVNL
jgi:hypothetical protein